MSRSNLIPKAAYLAGGLYGADSFGSATWEMFGGNSYGLGPMIAIAPTILGGMVGFWWLSNIGYVGGQVFIRRQYAVRWILRDLRPFRTLMYGRRH
jgi:hypothetical protein